MKMTGTRTIAAPPEAVWDALLDPEVLRDCVPGCKAMSGSADEGFEATVTQKVGPVKATFTGKVEITDRMPPDSLRLEGSGKGGPAGFASGGASVRMAPSGAGTELSYDVDAKVGGKIAQLGSRVVDAFAARMADQFFERFQARVEGGPASEPTAADAAAVAPLPEAGAAPVDASPTEPDGPARAPEGERKGLVKRILG
jgi:carbon monoxide dehydrogenase subunit G